MVKFLFLFYPLLINKNEIVEKDSNPHYFISWAEGIYKTVAINRSAIYPINFMIGKWIEDREVDQAPHK